VEIYNRICAITQISHFIAALLFSSTIYAQQQSYFQQEVDYVIIVTLDPENQAYSGTEKLTYTNNSPDTLEYIWIHLYPNAFRDTSTPFAKQKEKYLSRAFYYSKKEDRGYINITSLKENNENLSWKYKKDAI